MAKTSRGMLAMGGPEFSMRMQRKIRNSLYDKEPYVSVNTSQNFVPKDPHKNKHSPRTPRRW